MAQTTSIDWRLIFGVVKVILGVLLQLIGCLLYPAATYAGLIGVILVEVPLFGLSFYLILTSPGPLVVRLLLSGWIVIIVGSIVGVKMVSALYYRVQVWVDIATLQTEIILVPQGHREFVTIRFDDPAGEDPEHEGRKPVFRIGPAGELRTKTHQPYFSKPEVKEAQHERREFYWVDNAGLRTRINVAPFGNQVQSATDQILVFETGNNESDKAKRSQIKNEWFLGTPAAYDAYTHDLGVEDESFEVPHGFHGWATVIFDAPDGVEIKYSREFHIGPTGVLRTQAHEPKMHTARTQREREKKRRYSMRDGEPLLDSHPIRIDPITQDSYLILDVHEEYGNDCVSRLRFFVWTPAELGMPLGPTIRLAERQPALELPVVSTGDGVSITADHGATKVTNTSGKRNDTRLRWKGLKIAGPDLFLDLRLHGLPIENYPRDRGRLLAVGFPGSKSEPVQTLIEEKDSRCQIYFPDVPSAADLELVVESSEPFWITSMNAHAYPDVMYREYERGIVLVNPSPRPYSFHLAELIPGKSYARLQGYSRQDSVSKSGPVVGATLELPADNAIFLIRQ